MATATKVNVNTIQTLETKVKKCVWKEIIERDIDTHHYPEEKIKKSWGNGCYECDGYNPSCETYLTNSNV